MKNWIKENIIWIITCILIVITIFFFEKSKNKDLNNSNDLKHLDSIEVINFKDSVLNFIYDMRLEHPYIVYAQCIVETGNFTSTIMKENNNLFGMKLPERRATLALGVKRGHAYYRTWKESIIDYSLYQMAYMRGLSEEEYFEKLKQSYASDEYYIKKIRQLKLSLSR